MWLGMPNCCSVYFSFVLKIILLLCPGSIPEKDGDKLYSTCTVFSPTGAMLGKYRKVSVDLCTQVVKIFCWHVLTECFSCCQGENKEV